MTGKKRVFGSNFAKVDAHVIAPQEYDEAPDLSALTDDELARRVIRPMGRPRLPEGERRGQITMRWSPETIDALKARGPGWSNFAEEVVKRALKRERVGRELRARGMK
jgi:uncharacterized protein (DUF4415 family)